MFPHQIGYEDGKILRDNHLRELRTAQRLPILGLAVMAGVSTTTVMAIERWGYLPGIEVRKRLAAALRVTIDDIWPAELGFQAEVRNDVADTC